MTPRERIDNFQIVIPDPTNTAIDLNITITHCANPECDLAHGLWSMTVVVKRRPDGPKMRLPLCPRKQTSMGRHGALLKNEQDVHLLSGRRFSAEERCEGGRQPNGRRY